LKFSTSILKCFNKLKKYSMRIKQAF